MTLPLKRNENLQFKDIRDYSAKMKKGKDNRYQKTNTRNKIRITT